MSTSQPRSQSDPERNRIQLVVRQQPVKARLCSFKEKVDRRPVDPPPIVQLIDRDNDQSYLQNPYFFLYATLATTRGEDLHFTNGTRTTAGSVVQSLHKLKDVDNRDGGFFIFADISVRHEGFFKLKFTLFKIEESHVFRVCSVFSDPFQVYSPKTFPGMSESTFLTRCFSDQGVRIRIRKETRTSTNAKRRKTEQEHDPDDNSRHDRQSISPFIPHDPGEGSSSRFRLPHQEPATPIPYLTQQQAGPSSQESYSMHAMSMQNLLLSPQQQQQQQQQPHKPADNYGYEDQPHLFTQSLQLPPIVRRSATSTTTSAPTSFLASATAGLEPTRSSSSTASTSSSSNPSIQQSIADDYFIHHPASSISTTTDRPWIHHHHPHHQRPQDEGDGSS
ncbi:velvet factor-domain-containing protein [Fennellomyces sp. T-0311]|nr:velvet factor-domain-containing protein [Fennellomyces sp. T-0311]